MQFKYAVGFKSRFGVCYAEYHGQYVDDINKAHHYGAAYANKLYKRFSDESKGLKGVKAFKVPFPENN